MKTTMPGRRLLIAFALATVCAVEVQCARHTTPRVLKPHNRLQSAASQDKLDKLDKVGASAAELAALDCQGNASSCVDCNTVLSCAKLGNVLKPLMTTACPASTPYCEDGRCSATPGSDCLKAPNTAIDFSCVGDGYFPSPADCTKYYLCVDGLPYEYDCSAWSGTVYCHDKAMCVPTAETTCATVACTTATIGAYQLYRPDKSVYFMCTDTTPAHAYVADCGEDMEIDASTGTCVLACLREGRIADPDDDNKYYECVLTGTGAFSGPQAYTCPGNSTFSKATERCVSDHNGGRGGGGDADPTDGYEDYYAPNPSVSEDMYKLPEGFRVGSASAAYQVEGGWNTSDKTPSIWDVFFHSRPSMANGDIACDSYNKWRDDVAVLRDLGMQAYRFSLSWPRLLPEGDRSVESVDGLRYYNALINELLRVDIEPIITIHHWDMPQKFQEDGGWLNSAIQERFRLFADYAFEKFGDRVKKWVLMNEPHIFCLSGYEDGTGAPGVVESGTGGYGCVHNMILAHAKAYRSYDQNFRATQKGMVGSSLDLQFAQPASTKQEDLDAAERSMVFNLGWIADALVFGDYPQMMKDIILANSLGNGLTHSRLPSFTDEEKTLIKGTTDFIGLNHYTTTIVSANVGTSTVTTPSYGNDTNVVGVSKDEWFHSSRYVFAVCPWGLRGTLNWLKNRYNNIPVLITENGYAGAPDEGTKDPARLGYHSTYMRAMLRAINEDKCNVIGYTAWCLEDNLEWSSGYTLRFGLVHVDYESDNRTRTLKESSSFFQEVARTRKVNYYAPV